MFPWPSQCIWTKVLIPFQQGVVDGMLTYWKFRGSVLKACLGMFLVFWHPFTPAKHQKYAQMWCVLISYSPYTENMARWAYSQCIISLYNLIIYIIIYLFIKKWLGLVATSPFWTTEPIRTGPYWFGCSSTCEKIFWDQSQLQRLKDQGPDQTRP